MLLQKKKKNQSSLRAANAEELPVFQISCFNLVRQWQCFMQSTISEEEYPQSHGINFQTLSCFWMSKPIKTRRATSPSEYSTGENVTTITATGLVKPCGICTSRKNAELGMLPKTQNGMELCWHNHRNEDTRGYKHCRINRVFTVLVTPLIVVIGECSTYVMQDRFQAKNSSWMYIMKVMRSTDVFVPSCPGDMTWLMSNMAATSI